MSKQSIQPTKKLNQNTKSKIRAGMTNRMGTKTRKYGGTYGNTTTSKSGSKEQEGWVIDEYGNEVNSKRHFIFNTSLFHTSFKFIILAIL